VDGDDDDNQYMGPLRTRWILEAGLIDLAVERRIDGEFFLNTIGLQATDLRDCNREKEGTKK
jgi:hypothetical protein